MEEVKSVSEDVSVKSLKDVQEDPVDAQRMQRVKEAMIHAWSSYEKYAWGQDELQVQFYVYFSDKMIIDLQIWCLLLILNS